MLLSLICFVRGRGGGHVDASTHRVTTNSLNSNKIGPIGAQAIAEALMQNTKLTILKYVVFPSRWLADCCRSWRCQLIAARPCRGFVQSRHDSSLSSTQLGDAGAEAISKALRVNTTLTTLKYEMAISALALLRPCLVALR